MEYACVVCRNSMIGIEHLPDYLRDSSGPATNSDQTGTQKTEITWDRVERDFLYDTLEANNWNKKATAAQLGIHPTTLWRKMKHLDIKPAEQDGHTITG